MKTTYVEYGRTSSKNYQGQRLTIGANIEEGETAEAVYEKLKETVDSLMDGRKDAAKKLRDLATKVEAGEVSVGEVRV